MANEAISLKAAVANTAFHIIDGKAQNKRKCRLAKKESI
jgi:hypothetical protein